MKIETKIEMDRKAVSEGTKWQIIYMKDGSRISNRKLTSRLLTSENSVRITKTLNENIENDIL